ncbi:metallophosphoesterase [Halomonas elongata]|uniref:metallophosphoesterase n=1 Tax=Halomonas elongata TaxID=2746 RepID=UPI0038D4E53D
MILAKHDENTVGRDFIVGDIHGQLELLNSEMSRVKFDKAVDRLFSVGDLIDRGADSFDCLSLVFEPWFYGVRGNHEELARAALDGVGGRDWSIWQMNGGSWVYLHDAREVRSILNAAMEHLPYAREVEVDGRRIGVVHAEPPAHWQGMSVANLNHMVWGRSRILQGDESPVEGIDAVVVGHTPVKEPTTLGNVHYIDTGAFRTGRLTLLEMREVLG